MNILMVLTSHAELGDSGQKTGFWLEEFAAPYYALKDAGHEITLASPKGGQPPLDPKSDTPDAQTDATRRFKGDGAAQAQLATTERLDAIDATMFDGVFYPGGGHDLRPADGLNLRRESQQLVAAGGEPA